MLQGWSSVQNFCWIDQPHWSLVYLAYRRQTHPNCSPSCTLSVLLCKLYLVGTVIAARMEPPRALSHMLSTNLTPMEVLQGQWNVLAGIIGLGCLAQVIDLGKELTVTLCVFLQSSWNKKKREKRKRKLTMEPLSHHQVKWGFQIVHTLGWAWGRRLTET